MNKLEKLQKELDKINAELERLIEFRETPFLKKFRRQLEGEKSQIMAQIAKLTQTQEKKQKERQERQQLANKNRSEKMKRTWRYLKAIQKNYPTKLSLRELRSAFKKHKQGLEADIPDVAWRNPSP